MVKLNTPQDVEDWLERREALLDELHRDDYRSGAGDHDHPSPSPVPYKHVQEAS